MKKLVIIWIDAYSSRFLTYDYSPFLSNFSNHCFSAVISPMFAYMGIEYCFEYGVSLNELKIWNDHVFKGFRALNNQSKYSKFVSLLRLVDRVSFSDNLNKALRYALFRMFRVGYGVPHLIPPDFLDLFPVPNYHIERDSLFDVFQKNGVKFLRAEPKLNRSEPSLIKSVPRLLSKNDFILFKLNSLDRLGHKYGPASDIVKRRVRYLDGLLRELVNKLDEDVVFIVMSDHGMTPVTGTFDLFGFLTSKGFEHGRHYVSFVGSTYASFWFRNGTYKNAIVKALNSLEVGKLLTVNDRDILNMSSIGSEYGEEILVAKEHIAFFPEFYHVRSPPKGMHGYAFTKYDMPIFLMRGLMPPSPKEVQIEFTDIMPILLKVFGL